MNRRAFFGTMVGGVAAAAAVRTWPFRVFSFPEQLNFHPEIIGPKAIRFVKAYDVMQDRFISRFDVLYGFMNVESKPSNDARLNLELPRGADAAERLSVQASGFLGADQVRRFIGSAIEKYNLPGQAETFARILENRDRCYRDEPSVRGVEVMQGSVVLTNA